MTQTTSSLQVLCRPALARDHADVAEFCKGIWDGDDYVPEVWEEWLHDSKGLLAVAETNGQVIGCSKITWMSNGQWWLEGFRVDPKFQGQKVGARIHDYVTAWWLKHGNGILRLMTKSDNFAVHRVCENTGYVKTHEVRGYRTTPLTELIADFSPITDLREAAAFAITSESIRSTNGLADFGWRVGKLDESVFEVYSGNKPDHLHTFYWWRDKQGLLSTWENEDDERRTLCLGVVACYLSEMPALLMDARRFAAQKKFDSVFQIAFDIPEITSKLETAGFEKYWTRGNAFIFEKKHPTNV
jgi:RimJ/RimL family protein N-acetyltransferase